MPFAMMKFLSTVVTATLFTACNVQQIASIEEKITRIATTTITQNAATKTKKRTPASEVFFEKEETLGEEFDDRNHNIGEIARENNFHYEKHSVHTTDGHILTLDRITLTPPSSTGKKNTENKEDSTDNPPVVLLMHGIEDSSIQWVINSEDKAFAFILARNGYDVWLGNNRGNDFSLGHETLTKYDKEFWDFDFEEMGTLDVPAFIEYILNNYYPHKNAIDAYVGHSEGTTQFFIGSSLQPDYYAEKVGLFVGLAPIVRLDHSTNKAIIYTSKVVEPMTSLVTMLGIYDLISTGNTPKWLLGKFCYVLPRFCTLINEGFVDWNGDVDNLDRMADKTAHAPAGSGWRNLAHYGQIVKAKRFQRFDYGDAETNMEMYNGLAEPPAYDLSAINVPMALYHGDIDKLSDPVDVAWLLDESQSGLRNSIIVQDRKSVV